MKITAVRTKSGETVPIGKFTVLVGPNNVGKSRTLRDIHDYFVDGPGANCVILDEVIIEKPKTFDELFLGLQKAPDPTHTDRDRVSGILSNLTSGTFIQIDTKHHQERFERNGDFRFAFGSISKFRVSYLDAESRLKVAKATKSHNPHVQPPGNLLQGLFAAQDDTETVLRKAFSETFAMDLRLDYSGMQDLALRVAKRFEEIPADPRDAYPVLQKYGRLDEQGDGFRSFVGVVLSLLLSQGRVVLLDEPEAFLHPAQSRQLGLWIASHAATVPGQIIVATHNASFLSGILASGETVDIFRMNRTGDVTEYACIPPDATRSLVDSPLLSSQRVLESIFYRGVVVCEADADRAVYQTVATRFLSDQETMFVHAHNKQSVPKVVELLRAARIPVAAIVDLDALSSAGDLRKLVLSLSDEAAAVEIVQQREHVTGKLGVPTDDDTVREIRERTAEFLGQLEADEHDLSGARGALNRLRKLASDWYDLKTKGVDALPSDAQEVCRALIESCAAQGLFLVPVGELECWMDLGTTRKNVWVVQALEALHAGSAYPPGLKEFVEKVLASLRSAGRDSE